MLINYFSLCFKSALRLKSERIVVKRPLHSAALVASPAAHHSLKGSTQRFDVYIDANLQRL